MGTTAQQMNNKTAETNVLMTMSKFDEAADSGSSA
jgi:hypothetical protein